MNECDNIESLEHPGHRGAGGWELWGRADRLPVHASLVEGRHEPDGSVRSMGDVDQMLEPKCHVASSAESWCNAAEMQLLRRRKRTTAAGGARHEPQTCEGRFPQLFWRWTDRRELPRAYCMY